MAAVGELWLSWFSCCVQQPQKRRRRIDRYFIAFKRDLFGYKRVYLCVRSMIGEPTNFQHTGHIGSRDVELPGHQLVALQNQMKSKGGYESSYKVVAVTDWEYIWDLSIVFAGTRLVPIMHAILYNLWNSCIPMDLFRCVIFNLLLNKGRGKRVAFLL